jgi:hypothetical protein
VIRQLAHEPFGWRPTTLVRTIRRYRCKRSRRPVEWWGLAVSGAAPSM